MLTALPKIKEYLVTTNSFYRSPVKGSLGTYNADNENFPFIVNGKEVCLFRVPRKIAQTLKQNFVEALTYVDYRLNLDSGQVQLSPERIKIVFRDQEFYSEYVVDGTELQWQIQNQQY